MIQIKIPNSFLPERKYIVDVIFDEFLGLHYKIDTSNTKIYEIILDNGKKILIEDHFFSVSDEKNGYLDLENIPEQINYVTNQFVSEADIPVIFGSSRLEVSESAIICGIDLFASSFFMLTRWEEYVNKERDQHDRFPAIASLAYKNNFLDRPIVNEYLEMLWNMMLALGVKQERKKRQFTIKPTHDVDCPFLYAFSNIISPIRVAAKYILREKNIWEAIKQPVKYLQTKCGYDKYDPYFTFNYIMDVSEKYNLKSVFYFMAGHLNRQIDGCYDIEHPRIKKLIKHIAKRGHEIGLHGSYYSYNKKEQIKQEFDTLLSVLMQENINQSVWGSRQHYLRCQLPETMKILENAGLNYDTTLSYADHAGFRCGTCYEYPIFDYKDRGQLTIYEKPLIVMECSLFGKQYMRLDDKSGLEKIQLLKERCKRYHGTFVLLWHNSSGLEINRNRILYNSVLE
jgi:peptidoglycan/xylan/chitin deacetylase (PgdA/CDA1 family)